jgi:hypothetical protein
MNVYMKAHILCQLFGLRVIVVHEIRKFICSFGSSVFSTVIGTLFCVPKINKNLQLCVTDLTRCLCCLQMYHCGLLHAS